MTKIDKNFRGSIGGASKPKTPPPPTYTPDNLRSDDIVEVLLGVSEGQLWGLRDHAGPPEMIGRHIYVDNTPVRNEDGTLNFKDFYAGLYKGEPIAQPIPLQYGGTAQSSTVSVDLGEQIPVVRQTQRGEIDEIELRFNVKALYRSTNDGTFDHKLSLHVSYKRSDSLDWIPVQVPGGPTGVVEIYGKTTSTYVKEFRIPVPRSTVPFDIRVINQNNDVPPLGSNAQRETFSEVSWESFQEVIKTPVAYNDTAILHLIGKASNQFSSLPTFSADYYGIICLVPTNYDPFNHVYSGVWDGTFKKDWTNNPAWILYDIIVNDRYGVNAYFPASVDKFDVYEAAQWCDQLVTNPDGTQKPRYTFNAVIQQARSGKEMLRYLAGVFNGAAFDDLNGNIVIKVDKDDAAVALFTPENVTDGNFDYSYSDMNSRYNDITVTFNNPELNWAEDRRRVFNQDHINKYGRIPLDFIAIGCTDEYESIRRAHYKLITSITETEFVTFSTNRFAATLQPWDVILIADPDMGYALSGRLKSLSHDRRFITLREAVYLEAGVTYTARFQYADQVVERTISGATTGGNIQLTLDSALPVNIPDDVVFSIGGVGLHTGAPKPYRIISIDESDGNPDLQTINAVEINRNKWLASDTLTWPEGIDYRVSPIDEIPQPPKSVTLTDASYKAFDGTFVPKIRISWEPPDDVGITGYEIQYRLGTDVSWSPTIKSEGKINQIEVTSVRERQDYRARVRTVNRAGNKSLWTESNLGVNVNNDGKPPPPTGLSAIGGWKKHDLKWVNPDVSDFSHVEIWWADDNRLDLATVVGTTPANSYTVNFDTTNQIEKWYWIRAFDRGGNPSDFNSLDGAYAVTSSFTADDIQDAILDESKLIPRLRERIESIAGLENIAIFNDPRLEGLGDAFDQMSEAIMNAVFMHDEDFYKQNESLGVLDREVIRVEAELNQNIATVEQTLTAFVTDNYATAVALTQLESTFNNNLAAAESQLYTYVDSSFATAGQLTTVQADFNGQVAILQQSLNVTSSDVAGLSGEYYVKLDLNGYVSGFGLSATQDPSGVNNSEFIVVADKFAVIQPGTTGLTSPFVIGTHNGVTKVVMDNAFIEDLSVNELQVAGEAISWSRIRRLALNNVYSSSWNLSASGGTTYTNFNVDRTGSIANIIFASTFYGTSALSSYSSGPVPRTYNFLFPPFSFSLALSNPTYQVFINRSHSFSDTSVVLNYNSSANSGDGDYTMGYTGRHSITIAHAVSVPVNLGAHHVAYTQGPQSGVTGNWVGGCSVFVTTDPAFR